MSKRTNDENDKVSTGGFEATAEQDRSTHASFTEDQEVITDSELPGILTKEIFTELANYTSENCITIFLGGHAAGVEVNENIDLINFKNQLQEAGRRLREKGYIDRRVNAILEPGFNLASQTSFWKDMSPGLAVFIAEDYFKFIRMPLAPVEELTIIESSFYVTPLVPIMTSNEYFYLLVISKQCAKLFRGDCWGMQHVPIQLPQSIEEVKRLSGLDATTFRSGSSGSRAPKYSQESVYHGVGGGNPDDKDNMLVYFQAVDDILWKELLHSETVPLVLAAVEYEIPMYRSICNYNNIWPEALTGNREHQQVGILYEDIKAILKPYFEQRVTKALDLYMNNSANAKTSSIAADVIPAAYYSQISHLFVTKGEHIWGTFDEMSNELVFHDTPDENGENLIDNVVVKTLANGGEVFLLDREKMPVETQIAAIMRY
jgi:hypothetical protein